MDMSGAAAVLEAVAAIAELGLPIELIAVMPSTENMPSGTAIKPGDIITQYNGKTVEVNNTDAEGRLILADALAYCVELGAERIVDIATLTGAVLVALGSTYAALISNDDELASAVERAAEETGELAWRLPLHPEYKELTKGTVADLTNAGGEAQGGDDLRRLVPRGVRRRPPWAHLDIAGTAWDVGRAVRRQRADRLRRAPLRRARPRDRGQLSRDGCGRAQALVWSQGKRAGGDEDGIRAERRPPADLEAICDTVVPAIEREPDPDGLLGPARPATSAPTSPSPS